MKRYIFLSLLLAAAAAAGGQNRLSPSMELFLQSADKASKQIARDPSAASAGDTTLIPVFISMDDPSCISQLVSAGVRVGTVAADIATARVPAGRIRAVADIPGVRYIEKGAAVHTRLDEAKTAAGIDKIHTGASLPESYRGNGVVVGVVDMGFDYGHPAFYDTGKTHLRISRVWDQNKAGTAPAGFTYGAEYATEAEILAAACDMTNDTHGTHVLGIAAGADDGAGRNYNGVAGDAELVLVSLNTDDMLYGDNTTVMDAISYIYAYADAADKPCVINLSLGNHIGPHDGTSPFDRMADALQGPGRLLVGAVGNEGKSKFHLSHTFGGSDSEPERIGTFPAFSFLYSQYAMVEMWADPGMEFEFIPFIYDIAGGKVEKVCDPVLFGKENGNTGEMTLTIDNDNLAGSIRYMGEVNPDNDKAHAMVVFSFFRSDTHRIGFYVASKHQGTVHMWTDQYYSTLSNFGCEEFLDGDSDCSMGEVGGTGKRILSVGAYVTRDHYTNFGIYYPSGEEIGESASYTSRGPTPDGRVKPDISAPGSYIISAASSVYDGSIAKAASITWNGRKYPFGYLQGTSMASPLVAGVIATWLQANPELTPEQAKEILAQTAVHDAFTGALPPGGDNVWGHGKLDAWSGLKECLRLGSSESISAGPAEPLLLVDGRNVRVAFAADVPRVEAAVFTPSGVKVYAQNAAGLSAGTEYEFSLSALPAGLYVLRISSGGNQIVSQKISLRD